MSKKEFDETYIISKHYDFNEIKGSLWGRFKEKAKSWLN